MMTPTTTKRTRHPLRRLALAVALAVGSGSLLAGNPGTGADARSTEQKVTDARLEGQVWSAITLNRHLNPFEIDVEVRGGTAILTGTVDDAIDRELAERVALNADGIDRVENRIRVDANVARTDDGDRDFGDVVGDATTTAAVKSRLMWNDRTDGLDINVDTVNGRVTLTGSADSARSKALAERLAMSTRGVTSVDNRLAVAADRDPDRAETASENVSDAWITTKVKSALLYSKNVDGLDLTVDTRNGVVTLGGDATSRAERDLAIEIARDIKGVRSVDADGVRITGAASETVAGR